MAWSSSSDKSTGEANFAVSAGGTSLVLPKSGRALIFKGLAAGNNITLTPTANAITISASAPAVGLTTADKNLNPIQTAGNNSPTNITITNTPSGYVQVKVNGVQYPLLDGTKTGGGFFFSGDGGTTARAIVDIVAGDELFFNGQSLTVTFELETDDRIDLDYVEA